MVETVGDSEVLHHLGGVLRGSQGPEGSANWGDDLREKWSVDRVYRVRAVNCPSVRSRSIIHKVVIRVQPKRDVVGDPEDSISPTNDRFLIPAVGKADARGNIVFRKRNV